MKNHGFTLTELLVTLTLAAIMVSMAVPSYRGMVMQNRIAGLSNEVTAALTVARSEAIKRGVTVTLCRSSDQASCSGIWNNGWIIFADQDQDGAFDVGTDELIRANTGINDGRSLAYNGTPTSNFVQYLSTGFTNSQTGTFKVCPANNDVLYARGMIVSLAGRPRLSTDGADIDTIHEDRLGTNLTCP